MLFLRGCLQSCVNPIMACSLITFFILLEARTSQAASCTVQEVVVTERRGAGPYTTAVGMVEEGKWCLVAVKSDSSLRSPVWHEERTHDEHELQVEEQSSGDVSWQTDP
ncbi:hypothetical protein E2C01_056082 [Portunus trituberculatus]|uniref:Uncharacterized protein n=1 Tax=Portunus trituberculatus TaxID=210409 RepID=A0A5B7GWF4_PORTR|nr:hypothetical protein [Portunus trituberculatus]